MNQGSLTSICRLNTQIQINDYTVKKDEYSNILYFKLNISPKSVVYNNYDLSSILHFRGGLVEIVNATYGDGFFYITANYTRELQGKAVQM